MSSKNKALVSGVIAAVIAVALISGLMTHARATSEVYDDLFGEQHQHFGRDNTEKRFGDFGVFMTDPPTVPDGTTAVYINYSDVQVHVSGAGNATGWRQTQIFRDNQFDEHTQQHTDNSGSETSPRAYSTH